MYVKKNHYFLSSNEKGAQKRKLVLFSASRCIMLGSSAQTATQQQQIAHAARPKYTLIGCLVFTGSQTLMISPMNEFLKF